MSCCSPKSSSSTLVAADTSTVPPSVVATSKVHVHIHAADFTAAVAFYRAFFGANPVKVKPGYAKFLPIWCPLNIAISEHAAPKPGSVVSHLGIQLTSPAAVQAHLQRLKASGLTVREEMGVTCCHANQDKFWVTDPTGIEWEVYYLNFDVEQEPEGASTTSCCAR